MENNKGARHDFFTGNRKKRERERERVESFAFVRSRLKPRGERDFNFSLGNNTPLSRRERKSASYDLYIVSEQCVGSLDFSQSKVNHNRRSENERASERARASRRGNGGRRVTERDAKKSDLFFRKSRNRVLERDETERDRGWSR